jgi:hypothetical protein
MNKILVALIIFAGFGIIAGLIIAIGTRGIVIYILLVVIICIVNYMLRRR